MELYLDESGNTGCVKANKKNHFNFKEQRHFVLCGIKVKDEKDKKYLINKYNKFKEIFCVDGEIKGSDLMTRKYNKELEYFLENILDDTHFEVCIYDKKFYIVTLILQFILGEDFKCEFPVEYYQLAGILSFNSDDLLIEYCKLIENPNDESVEKFLKKIINYKFTEIPNEHNPIIIYAQKILDEGNYDLLLKDIFTYGSYQNRNYVNVINLNCLSELILELKRNHDLINDDLNIFHDNIDGYDKTFISELEPFNIEMNFVNSETEELIQIADNAASVIAKCINECIKKFESRKEWEEDSAWIMEHYAKAINKVDINNIKFTLPVQNWAVSLCIKDMFEDEYPVDKRKNIYFNKYYAEYTYQMYDAIANTNFDGANMLDLLGK